MVISRSNVGSEGSQSVEGSLVAPVELIAHVLGNLVQRLIIVRKRESKMRC